MFFGAFGVFGGSKFLHFPTFPLSRLQHRAIARVGIFKAFRYSDRPVSQSFFGNRLMVTHAPQHATASTDDSCVERIVQAAADLFSRHGYNGVSINAIAEAAGTSKANVFHHFRNKDELYVAVLRHVSRPSREMLVSLMDDDSDALARLQAFAVAHMDNLQQEADTARLIMRETLDPVQGEKSSLLTSEGFAENFSILVRIIRDGQHTGTLRADFDPATLATVLVGMNVFFTISRDGLSHFPEVDFAHNPGLFSERLLDLLFNGIRNQETTS